MFHDIPGLAECERVHQRVGTCQFVKVHLTPFVEVVVVRDEVHFVGPVSVIHAALVGGDHEIRGERLVGADFGDRVAFGLVEVEKHVVAESLEIELLTGVDHGIGAHEPWDEHFVEAVHFLTPESGAPRLVERADGAVLAFAPQAEGVERVVGVVIAIVPPVLVAHVPGGHVRVGAVAFGELAAQGERVFLEYRAGRAPRLARAGVDGWLNLSHGSTSMLSYSHSGAVAVAEARSVAMPALPSLSMMRSSQPKSQRFSCGWMRSQLKMARATVLTPAFS